MKAEMIKDDAVDAVRRALIDAELITEHRLGETRIDAQEFLDELELEGWTVVRKERGIPALSA